jgi:hypothetical protein
MQPNDHDVRTCGALPVKPTRRADRAGDCAHVIIMGWAVMPLGNECLTQGGPTHHVVEYHMRAQALL